MSLSKVANVFHLLSVLIIETTPLELSLNFTNSFLFVRSSFFITCCLKQQSKHDPQFYGVIKKNWDLAGMCFMKQCHSGLENL